jgi:hypothetical protein
MPLVFRHRFNRQDLRSQPETLFLFGDNELRCGLGGQAKECRGEPNACGIATKRAPGMDLVDYWSDADLDRARRIIDKDLERAFQWIVNGGTVICPKDGIGTGLSQLSTRAPAIFAYLRGRITDLRDAGRVAAKRERANQVFFG